MNAINEVLTTQEVAEMLHISDSYVRLKIKKGEFNRKEYRKIKGITIFNKKYIEEIRNKTVKS